MAGKARRLGTVSAHTDSLVGLPSHFTSWKTLETSVAYYRIHGGGGRVTKRSLGDTASAVHVRNMLGALDIVSEKGEPRQVALAALGDGRPDPVRRGLYHYLPHLIDLVEEGADVDEVRTHFIALGAGSRVLTFVLDTVERCDKDVATFRAMQLPAAIPRPDRRRSGSGSSGHHGTTEEVAESIRVRIRLYHDGLAVAVVGSNPEMVTVLSRELDRAERRLQGA